MCGISGVAVTTGSIDAGAARRMADVLSHRGPDDDGIYLDSHAALGHRRLSIIDLSADAHQPMSNEDGTLWLIYNGEIYNYAEIADDLRSRGHTFRSRTDSEVIIHGFEEWGDECLQKLNGMFAFALWDKTAQRLVLGRDRLGVKPLYYYADASKIVFGSELKAILSYPGVTRDLDHAALDDYFSLNYVVPPKTPFRDIKQVEPGHLLNWEKGKYTQKKYWDVRFQPANGHAPKERDLVPEVFELLKECVRKRLVADVPVGAFLSGGLDSSAVVYFMRQFATGPLKTFSVRFADKSYDEGTYALEVAKLLGTDHHEVFCTAEDMASLIEKSVYHADNLTADISNVPMYMVSRLARQHVTVVLSGDGGDEVFGGYPIYQADRLASYYRRVPAWLRNGMVQPLVHALPASSNKLSLDYKARKFVEGAALSPARAHYTWRTIFTPDEKLNLYSRDFAVATEGHLPHETWSQLFAANPDISDMEKGFYSDYKTFLSGSILPKIDTMSMASSLEAREPLLDYELVEYMARVPLEFKLKGLTTKYLFKKAMSSVLPERIVYRKKAGFHTPLAGWFRKELRSLVEDVLSKEKVTATQVLDSNYVERLKQEHHSGQANHSYKIWGLMNFMIWCNHFGKAAG